MMNKFNISLQELEDAVEFSKNNDTNEFGTITLHINQSGGLGLNIAVSKDFNSERFDITNINSW